MKAENRAARKAKNARDSRGRGRGRGRWRPYTVPSAGVMNFPAVGGQPSGMMFGVGRGGRQGPCYFCGQIGHFKANCPVLAQMRQKPGDLQSRVIAAAENTPKISKTFPFRCPSTTGVDRDEKSFSPAQPSLPRLAWVWLSANQSVMGWSLMCCHWLQQASLFLERRGPIP